MKDLIRVMLMMATSVTVLFGSLALVHPEYRVFLIYSWAVTMAVGGYLFRRLYKRW